MHHNCYEICYGYTVRFTKFNEYLHKYRWMVYEVECLMTRKPIAYTFIVPQDSQRSDVYQEWLELFQTLTGDEKYSFLASHFRLLYEELTGGSKLIPFQEDMDVDLANEPFMMKYAATSILVLLDDLVQGQLTDTDSEIPSKHIRRLRRWYRGFIDSDSDSTYREDGLY